MVFRGGKIAEREPTEQELKIKIQFLMAFRVIIITTFLGSIILFRPPVIQIPFILPISFIIAATYAITIIYALLLPRVTRLVRFCYIQILGDLLLETAVVYYTGGVDSFFSFLYILTIITTSMILYKRGSYIAASAASIFFGLVVNLEFYKVIEPQNYYLDFPIISENDSLFYSLFLRIAAFYIVAILSGQLAGKLKETGQELEEKREDLIELKNFHENVVESIQMGLLTVDLDYKITSLNRYSQEVLGIKEWETVGKPCQKVLPPEKFKELYDEYAYSRPTIHRFEGVYRRGDGAELHLGFTLSRLINEQNEVNGLIISFTDLSTIKALEEKMRRSERLASIGELASGMAHEVRNPLASISGSIEMLSQREGQDHTRKQLMEIVLKETERLNKIITDFLSYARPQPSRKETVDVNTIIKETMDLMAAGLNDQKQIAFHSRLHEGPLLAMADSQELRQVLWNLCVNAVESMDGGGELRVSTRLQDRHYLYSKVPAAKLEQRSYPATAGPEQYVAITVEDNGKGIRRQDLDKIFDPFYTTKDEGTGLGLSIAYRIVEKHDGFIDVESEIGEGTCIRVFLPAGEQEPSGMGHPHQPEGEGEGQE